MGEFMRVSFGTYLVLPACLALLLGCSGCRSQRASWDLNGKMLSINLGSALPLELRRIDPGSFSMGATAQENTRYSISQNELPAHPVTIDRPFFIATYETTNEHYDRFDPEHDSNAAGASLPEAAAGELAAVDLDSPRLPVVGVSHDAAEQYCEWLSEASGLRVRLPSEAEWEYACKSGSETAYSWGDSRPESSSHANLAGNSTGELLDTVVDPAPREDGSALTARVASFRPNNQGLYDMHGNVAEWCADVYADNYNNTPSDGSANTVGNDSQNFVVRGGSWASGLTDARSSAREHMSGDSADAMTGFRIVVEVPEEVGSSQ